MDIAEAVAPGDPILVIDNVTKEFPGVVANDSVSIDVNRASIHCLLGENGAGKTTLADILYGVFRPDSGQIRLEGRPLDMASPGDAIAAGIGMVHQHFELVPPMSVIENVVIGTPARQWLDLTEARRRLEEFFADYDVEIDPDAEVGRLSVGEQQWVEIFKTLYFGVEILILDEPTAVLTPQGVTELFAILRRMRDDGLTIILITHKLKEVMDLSDRVTVLRRGRVVDTVATDDVDQLDLARMMVGRDVLLQVDKQRSEPGAPVLEADAIHVESDTGRGALKGLSLNVGAGEIVGVAGVSGNGQNALFDSVVGVRHPHSGTIRITGQDVTTAAPHKIARLGVACVPADRIAQGLMMDFSIKENLVLGNHRSSQFSRAGILNQSQIDAFAAESIESFEIKTPSADQVTRTLSGGNLQKIIMARELYGRPALILAHQPTRGLDIAASEYVRQRLVQERDRGAGVLLMSEDLDEIFQLADRIAVIFDGRIVAMIEPDATSLEEIGMHMAGAGAGAP
ncbi:MAG: ABC transporter ATP-binding protein [Acidimicrobiaceae bacterium]|nr:ABC transporter ATP-binding protein [Acidimicrobiaceae bacterium]MCY4280623.1 ABC transporter ATP-binding protein [Acidimicrobiaceae bacterium]MCY4294284.1 ABC transporter ATP-binding protein [Acidimicrobiaceae bacterium]